MSDLIAWTSFIHDASETYMCESKIHMELLIRSDTKLLYDCKWSAYAEPSSSLKASIFFRTPPKDCKI